MPGRNFTDSEEEQIAMIYLAGHSTRKIAKAYGLAHHISITAALKRQGVRQRKPADRNRLYQLDKYVFDSINNEESAYWWGFLYADGCVHKRSLKLALSAKDKMQVEGLKTFLKCEHPIKIADEKLNGKTFQKAILYVTSKHLTVRLRQLGIKKGRGDLDSIKNLLPDYLINHWIRGYFDGDGFARKKCDVGFVGSRSLLTCIRKQLAINANINPNLVIRKVSGKNIHRLVISGRIQASNVANFMYQDATVWMQRKRDVINQWIEPK